MPSGLTDDAWETLLWRIEDKQLTPFLGAGASAEGGSPLGRDIASRWAAEHGYPLSIDCADLAQIAQYLAVRRDRHFPKMDLKRLLDEVDPPDFDATDEPHALLADLELPFYITTNYDDFMMRALADRDKRPQRELCTWNDYVTEREPSKLGAGIVPTIDEPMVYHLHGSSHLPPSMVLTEDDYLDFLVRFSTDQDLVPDYLRLRLADTSLLFMGYSLNDWNFRVLFRALIGSLGTTTGMLSVAVQLTPPLRDDSPEARRRAEQYLDSYLDSIGKVSIRTFWGTAGDFTNELRQRWQGGARGG